MTQTTRHLNRSQTTLSAEAEKAIRRGFSLTPLNGKRPILDDWTTIDDVPLDRLLQHVEDGHNLGLRTGQASGGLVVIDVDPGGDVSSLNLPDTVTVETGREGGRHYYYRHDGEIRNSAGRLGPNIDVKAEGGQVVYPGSRHPDTGRFYRWAAGRSPDDVDIAPLPDNIISRLRAQPQFVYREREVPIDCGGPIPEGMRNDYLFRMACGVRSHGGGEEAILAMLRAENAARCRPAIPDEELQSIAAGAASYERGPLPDAKGEEKKEKRERGWHAGLESAGATLDSSPDVPWIIEDVLAAGEPMIIGAPLKTMKTSTLLDLCVAAATGKWFLGHYPADGQHRVALFVGETSRPVMRTRLRGIIKAHPRWEHAIRENLHISYKVPRFYRRDCVDEIRRVLRDGFSISAVDPYYMAIDGTDSANLMIMGEQLADIVEMHREAQATPIFSHHTKKSSAAVTDGSLNLNDLCGAGVAEFARQWIILGRNGEYDHSGRHHLFATVGGAYHSTKFGLEIDEGTRLCPKWITEVIPVEEAKAETKARVREGKYEEHLQAALAIMNEDDPMVVSQIAARTGMSGARAKSVLLAGVDDGRVRVVPMRIRGKQENGYCRVQRDLSHQGELRLV